MITVYLRHEVTGQLEAFVFESIEAYNEWYLFQQSNNGKWLQEEII